MHVNILVAVTAKDSFLSSKTHTMPAMVLMPLLMEEACLRLKHTTNYTKSFYILSDNSITPRLISSGSKCPYPISSLLSCRPFSMQWLSTVVI